MTPLSVTPLSMTRFPRHEARPFLDGAVPQRRACPTQSSSASEAPPTPPPISDANQLRTSDQGRAAGQGRAPKREVVMYMQVRGTPGQASPRRIVCGLMLSINTSIASWVRTLTVAASPRRIVCALGGLGGRDVSECGSSDLTEHGESATGTPRVAGRASGRDCRWATCQGTESRPEGRSQDGERDGVDDSQGSGRQGAFLSRRLRVGGVKAPASWRGQGACELRLACLSLGCSFHGQAPGLLNLR